ncbi:cell wall anchor protein [Olleya sp. UBA1516]|uniref:cell wall anchor protein n=1 Tax=Olleya sp. UBA1516 TaxID=1947013 RepID=UPI0025E0FBFB|nr:cell wall anchor protein [Olleya sp. UBA1516]|tara:strand:+ start:1276 stop:2724 length:1449 start_codon:yes stop_codon:yes gene_type:complete
MSILKLKISIVLIVVFISVNFQAVAQVGIGTLSPDASAMLEVNSTEKGMLAPRMTSAQRIAISNPAEGLLVFDTDINVFYFYDGNVWTALKAEIKRSNYKLVKDISDLADELVSGGGSKYVLNENYLYEINGNINFDFPVDLNGAYVSGRDTGEDALVNNSGATFFSGSKGGHFKDIVIRGNNQQVFNISGSGTENLIAYSLVIVGASSVGTFNNLNTFYFEVLQVLGTGDGISASNISNYYMDKVFWTDGNSGTFLKFSGIFSNLQIANGRVVVDSGETGIDVSSNPTINISASIAQVSFTGGGSRLKGYTENTYAGYKFNSNWDVDATGLQLETDDASIGDIHLESPIGSGFQTDFTSIGSGVPTKLEGLSYSNNLFRFSAPINNRLVYDGVKTRSFQISSSISFQGDNNSSIYIFYIAKNGVVQNDSKVYRQVGSNNDVGAVSVVGSVKLDQGDYIEVWAERYSGAGSLLLVSLNLIIK